MKYGQAQAIGIGQSSDSHASGYSGAAEGREGLPSLRLWKRGTQPVFGEGEAGAKAIFVGEQPGDREDLEGKPFVGPAGGLLDKALVEAGIERKNVYVTNRSNTSNGSRAASAAFTKN